MRRSSPGRTPPRGANFPAGSYDRVPAIGSDHRCGRYWLRLRSRPPLPSVSTDEGAESRLGRRELVVIVRLRDQRYIPSFLVGYMFVRVPPTPATLEIERRTPGADREGYRYRSATSRRWSTPPRCPRRDGTVLSVGLPREGLDAAIGVAEPAVTDRQWGHSTARIAVGPRSRRPRRDPVRRGRRTGRQFLPPDPRSPSCSVEQPISKSSVYCSNII
jgi:hypothetical protein